MNRRDLLKTLGLTSAAGAVIIPTEVLRSCHQLDPKNVSADMRVFDKGNGDRFEIVLLGKPWPKKGERIVIEWKRLVLRGLVTETEVQPIGGFTDRCKYHIAGVVEYFDAPGAKEK